MARGKASGAFGAERRGRKGGADESNRWLGTYGDAVTLLMAFFVMLYSMAEMDVDKFNAFLAGLQGPFGNEASADMLTAMPALVGEAGAQAPTRDPGAVTTAPPGLPTPPQPSDAQLDPFQRAQLEQVKAEIQAALAAAGAADVASYEILRRGLVVSVAADDILFATGSATLSDAGRAVIAAVAGPLRAAPNEILVEGHTDDVPLRRGAYTNWNLSTDRAVSVLSMLFGELDVPQERLGAAGYGQFRPRTPNTDARSRALNRRVDIVVVTLPESSP
jgi:chemotaxis protein MotB